MYLFQVQPAVDYHLLLSILTVAAAGISSFVGVRVALAEARRDIRNLEKRLEDCDKRFDRLEEPFFKPKH